MDPPPPSKRSSALSPYLQVTNLQIHRINRLLSTTSSLDLTLSTLTYTLSLLSHTIPSTRQKKTVAASLSTRLLRLSSLLSETRTTLRLFSLLRLLPTLLSLLFLVPSSPPTPTPTTPKEEEEKTKNPTTTSSPFTLTLIRATANTIFQILENTAFLASKNILPLRSSSSSSSKKKTSTQERFYILSARAWAVSVACDVVQLIMEFRRRFRRDAGVLLLLRQGKKSIGAREGEGEEKEEKEVETKDHTTTNAVVESSQWSKDALITACWAPVAVHYSLEGGMLGERAVALLGLLGSAVGLREAWRGLD